MKHTPGPWKVSPNLRDTVIADTPIDTGGIDTGHNHKDYYGGYCVGESIWPQNIDLIAAAPELLESLIEVLKFHDDEIHDIKVWDKARQAVNKARGEITNE